MKRLLLILVLLLFSLSPSFSTTLFLKKDRVKIETVDGVYEWGKEGYRILTPRFSFGGVDGGGDIALLINPHSSRSKGLYYSLFDGNTRLLSSSLNFSSFTLSFLLGERNGLGLSYEKKDYRFFLYSFLPGEDEEIQKDWIERRDRALLYLGLETEWRKLSLSSYFSITSNLLFSSMVKGEIELPWMSVEMRLGRLQSLLESNKNWESSISFSLGKGEGKASFSVLLGKKPKYIGEYRSLSFTSKGKIRLGEVYIEGESSRTFEKGKEKSDASLSISSSFWKIRISRTSGLIISFNFDSSSFLISKDKLETTITIKRDDAALTIHSSGEDEVEAMVYLL